MTFQCLDCNQQIEGDPWWYDPFAHATNRDAQEAQLTGVVTQQPDPPTSVAGPSIRRAWSGKWVVKWTL
jgi:hypothetical protein